MENTGKILFGSDTAAQWFVAIGDQTLGPMTAGEVYDRIRAGEFTWVHYVWREGQKDWVRACDSPTFQPAMPRAPAARPPAPPAPESKKAPAPPTPEPRNWFLYYNDTQFGPFSVSEVRRFLEVGKIHARVHAWRDGMGGWVRLEEIAEFAASVAESKRVRADREQAVERFSLDTRSASVEASEKRKTPRFPLVARLLVADDEQVTVAVCRDISVGGMQVLTDRLPGPVGTRLRLNVSPAGGVGKTKSAIAAFVAEGEVVRILEDARGYSFRFKKLPEKSRQAIEAYIRETEGEA